MFCRLIPGLPAKQFDWRNDPRIYATCRQQGPLSRNDHISWSVGLEKDKTRLFFVVEITEESKVPGFKRKPEEVGTAGLTSISPFHGTAEWSLLIGPEHQGKGYAREALKELLRYGFECLRLNVIWGEIMDGNIPCLGLAQKMGMKVESKLRERYWKGGKYIDSYIVSMTSKEWKEKYGTAVST